MKTLSTLVLAAGLVLGACGKKDKEAPPTPAPAPTAAAGSGSAEAGSAAGSAETPPPAVAEEPIDVATEMDYEDLANSEITEATVEARLKALESDLTTQ